MKIYIICVLRDIKTNKRTHYVLLDTDNNNELLKVTAQQLLDVMKSKKAKIHNARLYGNSIVGTYYSLKDLTPISITNGSQLVLSELPCKKYKLLRVYDNKAHVNTVSHSELMRYAQINNVINVVNGEVLCEKEDTQIIQCKDNLDREAYNKNIVWSVEKFEKFMHSHGWSYSLSQQGGSLCLSEVSSDCEVLHIPYGVTNSIELFISKPTKLDTVIFPPKFYGIVDMWKGMSNETESDYQIKDGPCNFNEIDFLKVRNMYFQNNDTETVLKGNGLRQLIITNELEIHKYLTIKRAFSCCCINTLNALDTDSIYLSFNNIRFNTPTELLIKSRRVNRSFIMINNLSKITSRKASALMESFTYLDVKEVDIDEVEEKQIEITNCFENCKNIEKLDFSKCVNSNYIGSRWRTNQHLKEIILPMGIYQFHYTNEDNPIKVVFQEDVTSLDSLLSLGEIRNTEFKGKITHISDGCYCLCKERSLKELSIPESIETIGNICSHNSSLLEFDTKYIPKVKIIPEELFKRTKIETIIIRDNVEELKDKVFSNAENIRNVYLGAGIKKVGKHLFEQDNQVGKIPNVYVIKDSNIHKKLKTRSYNINIIQVESIDEALERMSSSKTSDSKIAKYKVMLNNGVYSNMTPLLKTENIDNIDFNFKLIKTLEDNVKKPVNMLTLNTSKFKELNLSSVERIKSIADKDRDTFIMECNTANYKFERKTEHEDKFISLCNLITTIYDNNINMYSDRFIKSLNESAIINPSNTIYLDDKDCIEILTIKFYEDVFITVVIIVIEQTIVFQSLINLNGIITEHEDTQYRICHRAFSSYRALLCDAKYNVSVTQFLKKGDFFTNSTSDECIVGGIKVPADYTKTLYKNVLFNFKYIGYNSKSINQREISYKRMTVTAKTLYYDTVTSKFIEVRAKMALGNSIQSTDGKLSRAMSGILSMNVINIYEFNEIDKIPECYFKTLKEESKLGEKLTQNLSASKEQLNSMYNNMSNYDTQGNKYLCELADYITENNLTLENLLNGKAGSRGYWFYSTLFSTSFFDEIDTTLNNTKNLELLYIKQIDGTDYKIIEWKMPKEYNKSLTAIVDSNSSMKKSGYIKYSWSGMMNTMVKLVFSMSIARRNGLQPLNKITDEKINIQNFYCIDNYTTLINNNGNQLWLAFDKANGDAYLIGGIYDTDFYTLFRFKPESNEITSQYMADLLNTQSNMYVCNVSIMRTILGYCHENRNLSSFKPNNYDKCYSLFKLRAEIIKGLPNGYPYIGSESELEMVDKLAKQPRETTDN